jgi:hypothetical protein
MLQFGASLLTTLAKARIVNYNRNCSFIVLATVIMIVNYDCHLFKVQATGLILFVQSGMFKATDCVTECSSI